MKGVLSSGDLLNYISLAIGVVSLYLAIKSMNDSNKVNKDTIAIQKEMSRYNSNVIYSLRGIEDELEYISSRKKITLNKYNLIVIKTSRYKVCNAHEVIPIVSNLDGMKDNLLEGLNNFLHNSNKDYYSTNFKYVLSQEEMRSFIPINDELYKYGLMMFIHPR